jgi:hypothetical protein
MADELDKIWKEDVEASWNIYPGTWMEGLKGMMDSIRTPTVPGKIWKEELPGTFL